jgi:saccharopine dehydrogenase (NADP+, L-glutamate forming)
MASAGKKVLVLGAGYCTQPLVQYLSDHGVEVTVGSRTLAKAQELCRTAPRAHPVEIDVEQPAGAAKLQEIIPGHVMVISMLPWLLHGIACQAAIHNGAHFLTTSYVQPAVRALGDEAVRRGLIILNECGVDPGTDHMSAKKVIDEVHAAGGQVVEFTSFCGGLPAPDANDNPFGYKFSWAPRGVLLASVQPAKFLRAGQEVEVPPGTLFKRPNFTEHIKLAGHPVLEQLVFEGYPNRDSTPYREIYGLPEAQTLIRGTYRYTHWCDIIQSLSELGLLATAPADFSGLSYLAFLHRLLAPAETPITAAALDQVIRARLHLTPAQEAYVLPALTWLGLFSDQPLAAVSANTQAISPLDVVCDLMQAKMQYGPGQRDLIVLQHRFTILFSDRREVRTSTLVQLGTETGITAMSRTVAIPVAIAARLILEGTFTKPGLSIPTIPELYQPILQELADKFDIAYIEETVESTPL